MLTVAQYLLTDKLLQKVFDNYQQKVYSGGSIKH